MKTIITTVFAACIAVTALASGKEVSTENYKISKSESKITWTGKKVTGQHTGNVEFADGTVTLDGGSITAISANVDMNSITCTDLQGDMAGKLVGHLKSDDFFGVDKHPTASFELTKVAQSGKEDYSLTGKLTIKGISHDVSFPARVVVKGGKVLLRADIAFDRTKYDIKYGSGSFFDDLGDKAINDEVTFSLLLVAEK